MKKYILFAITTCIGLFTHAQIPTIAYAYDVAGNRIQRNVIYLIPRSTNASSFAQADTLKDQRDEYQFTLFPNPTDGELFIEADEKFMALSNKRVLVVDLNGRPVIENTLLQTRHKIDLSSQPIGEYIVKITANSYSIEWKVIKK